MKKLSYGLIVILITFLLFYLFLRETTVDKNQLINENRKKIFNLKSVIHKFVDEHNELPSQQLLKEEYAFEFTCSISGEEFEYFTFKLDDDAYKKVVIRNESRLGIVILYLSGRTEVTKFYDFD